jgi:glycosyltransferase involved in cell wall biosynthesis
MRVLYAALRHDPLNPIASSSVDYGFFTAISKFAAELATVGPFVDEPPLVERIARRAYRRVTGKKYIKWDFATIIRATRALNKSARMWKPNVVFSMFPAGLAFYNGAAPFVYCTDLAFGAWQEHGAGFGRLALRVLVGLERRAVRGAARVIVHSEWGKRELVQRHGIDPEKVRILVMPAAIPLDAVPVGLEPEQHKELTQPLRLLLVGREFHRKGVDIALEILTRLNDEGTAAELVVCGIGGPATERVTYVGPYRKNDQEQLGKYLSLYRWANLLLHPARFEAAGIVPSEAAAFGTPTLTNDTGGLGTTVADGTSGVVLPKGSEAPDYVAAIQALVGDPRRYYALCRSSRMRYERELNWGVAAERVQAIFSEACGDKREPG